MLHALLNELPKSVTVQLRTMYMKQRIFGVPTGTEGALTPRQAFSGSDLSRVGHHNDCFLASPDDFGTFLSDPLSLDEDYLAADSRYVPVGGETCTVNPPKSEWPSARALMERFHYSYLNTEYNQDVLSTWGSAGYEEAANRLGYRFTLLRGAFSRQVVAGHRLHVDLTVRNSGFASPVPEAARAAGPRRRTTTPTGSRCPPTRDAGLPDRTLASGPRWRFLAGSSRGPTASHSRCRRRRPPSQHRADYAIRTANVGTWNAAKGWNRLGVDRPT